MVKTPKLRVLCRHTNLGNGVKIDLLNEAIHLTMLHKDEGCWQALLEAQGRLYEEFGLDD